eukprot:g1876.t1
MSTDSIWYPRLPPAFDFNRRDIRIGTLIGILILFATQSSTRDHLTEAVAKLFIHIKYLLSLLDLALMRLAQKSPIWLSIRDFLRSARFAYFAMPLNIL